MKFSINQSELQDALAVVLKGIATRSTLPILSGIYLDAHNDNLTLQATDLELSIQFTIPALVEEEGRSVFPGKLFFDIVKNLPDAAVHVETGEDSAVITCDASSFSIKTLDAEDFPGFPHVDTQQAISIPFSQFSSMVKRVARVVSKDESRAILTGVLITFEPFIAAFFSWLWWGEQFSLLGWIGAVAIIFGIILTTIERKPQDKKSQDKKTCCDKDEDCPAPGSDPGAGTANL